MLGDEDKTWFAFFGASDADTFLMLVSPRKVSNYTKHRAMLRQASPKINKSRAVRVMVVSMHRGNRPGVSSLTSSHLYFALLDFTFLLLL